MTAAERPTPAAAGWDGPGRLRLAAAARDLLDVVVGVDADDAALDRAGASTERVVAALRAGGRERSTRPPGPGRHAEYLPRSPALGAVHPAAPPLVWDVRDGRFVARGTLGLAFEGPPGYVHGGWVALLFDEALGVANVAGGHPGMTGRLSIRYRRPTPLQTELRLEAWTVDRQGRRITTVGTLHAGDALCAEAEGLFVDIGAERALAYFGDRPATPEPVDPLP